MPLYTEHLNLAKPNRDERYNVAVPNGNMDILDETIRALREENQALREELAGKANICRPIEYDLELTEGYISQDDEKCRCYKKDNGEVVLTFAIMDENLKPTIAGKYVILFNLPEGFRPSHDISFSVAAASTGVIMPGVGHLQKDGNFWVNLENKAFLVHGCVVFLAAE